MKATVVQSWKLFSGGQSFNVERKLEAVHGTCIARFERLRSECFPSNLKDMHRQDTNVHKHATVSFGPAATQGVILFMSGYLRDEAPETRTRFIFWQVAMLGTTGQPAVLPLCVETGEQMNLLA